VLVTRLSFFCPSHVILPFQTLKLLKSTL
jgi:hypothetical protein